MSLKHGDKGEAVRELQRNLLDAGFSPGAIDGTFGAGTQAAVLAFQRSEQLSTTGVADDATLKKLEEVASAASETLGDLARLTVGGVSGMFPGAPLGNIKRHLPIVLSALVEANLAVPRTAVMALATIRAETAGFVPISEFLSRFNTSPGGHPFDLYDKRKDLGNLGPPDGERFKGRGFIQLTGRDNYERIGGELGLGSQLVLNPDLANDPDIAARILSRFIKNKLPAITAALDREDLREARKLVNGGAHGLKEFTEAFHAGMALLA